MFDTRPKYSGGCLKRHNITGRLLNLVQRDFPESVLNIEHLSQITFLMMPCSSSYGLNSKQTQSEEESIPPVYLAPDSPTDIAVAVYMLALGYLQITGFDISRLPPLFHKRTLQYCYSYLAKSMANFQMFVILQFQQLRPLYIGCNILFPSSRFPLNSPVVLSSSAAESHHERLLLLFA